MQLNIDGETGLPLGDSVSAIPATRPRRTTLRGRYVSVAPLSPARHGPGLWEGTHLKDKERLWLYMGEGPFADRMAFDAYLQRKASAEDPLFFTVLNEASDALGHLALMRIEPVHRAIEVGHIMYSPALQKTPGGTEAIYLIADHVFSDLGFRRLEWKCNSLNEASRRAALRFGFTFEGIFRKHMIVKGRNRDTAWYSLLDTEWHTRRLAFEAWLNPNNFDESGVQRESLTQIRAKSER